MAVTASSRINKNKFYGKKDNDTSNEKITTKDEHEKEDNGGDNSDDLQLSLELMENAWSILDEHYNETTKTNTKYKHWIENQIPRYLIGIGEILSIQKRHADAVDAYTRALPYRESSIQNKKEDKSIEYLRQRRLFTEVNVLIAEELLVCYNENSDIITYETKSILVKKEERIDFIQGYYDKGRDELQETVYLMGRIASSIKNDKEEEKEFNNEKENICFLSTMLMAVGNSLADLIDEEETKQASSSTGDTKRQKKA